MVAPSPVVTTLVNEQLIHCLLDTESEITTMDYDFYVQWFGAQTRHIIVVLESAQQLTHHDQLCAIFISLYGKAISYSVHPNGR